VGLESPPFEHAYSWRDTVLYALSVGCTTDELDFLYEKFGPKVLPTFITISAFPAAHYLFDRLGGDAAGLVHGGQRIKLHRPLQAQDKLFTTGKVAAMYDLKRLAQVVLHTTTQDAQGQLVAETEMDLIFRFDGNFGGSTPPRRPKVATPEGTATFNVAERIPEQQALLYRLNGDLNPLHADPELARKVGFDRPILHGLCTVGYVARALVKHVCKGDPTRFVSLSGQFRNPVLPGHTLITEGWVADRACVVRARTQENPEQVVFGQAVAEFS